MDRISDYDGWNIVVSPLRLKGADGSPARVFIYKEG
jgi:kynurenine formamidase